jgi:hypothetical protein
VRWFRIGCKVAAAARAYRVSQRLVAHDVEELHGLPWAALRPPQRPKCASVMVEEAAPPSGYTFPPPKTDDRFRTYAVGLAAPCGVASPRECH